MDDSTAVEDRDIDITRAFRAPRPLVWRYWTEPALLAEWFGPDGFSSPLELIDVDLRVGGAWSITMRDDATGDLYPVRTTIVQLVPEELLVVEGTGESDMGDITMTLRVQFHDHGELTRVTLHQGPFTPEQRTATATGWEMSFVAIDRLLEAASA